MPPSWAFHWAFFHKALPEIRQCISRKAKQRKTSWNLESWTGCTENPNFILWQLQWPWNYKLGTKNLKGLITLLGMFWKTNVRVFMELKSQRTTVKWLRQKNPSLKKFNQEQMLSFTLRCCFNIQNLWLFPHHSLIYIGLQSINERHLNKILRRYGWTNAVPVLTLG